MVDKVLHAQMPFTTGRQTINDRLTAAYHSLAGSQLGKTVCKPTTEESIGPKKKHLDCSFRDNLDLKMSAHVVHRCQLYRPSTSAVNSLSFNEKLQKLALIRENGVLQVWDTSHRFVLEREYSVNDKETSESVIWCQNRLFTVGSGGFLTEWSIKSGFRPFAEIKIATSQVWCVAKNASESHLIAGTEDGAILKCAVIDGDSTILLEKPLTRTERRILSLFWHESKKTIVSGSANVIRIWNADTGRCLQRITVGRDAGAGDTLIWSIIITRDFVIASGDSRGITSFWDAKNGTLINSFRSHKSDVLAVCYDEAKNCVYSAGIDPTICQFTAVDGQKISSTKKSRFESLKALGGGRIAPSGGSSSFIHDELKQWAEGPRLNLVDRETRCLATAGDWLVIAGLNARMTIYKYPPKTVRSISLENPDRIRLAKDGNFLLFRYESHCEIWRLGSADEISDDALVTGKSGDLLNLHQEPEKFAEIKTKKGNSIIAAAISDAGDYLAYSDHIRTRLIKINQVQDEGAGFTKPKVILEKLNLFNENRKRSFDFGDFGDQTDVYLPPSDSLVFIQDVQDAAHFLIISSSAEGAFLLFEFTPVHVKLVRRIAYPEVCSFVTKIFYGSATTMDSRVFAFLTSENDVFVADVENKRPPLKLRGGTAVPIDAKFGVDFENGDQQNVSTLIVLYADWRLLEFSLADGRYSDWCRSMCQHWASHLAERFPESAPNRLSVSPTTPDRLFVYSAQRLISVHKKRLSGSDEKAISSSYTDDFAELAYVDFLSNGRMLVVQMDRKKFDDRLPAPFKTKRFGTG